MTTHKHIDKICVVVILLVAAVTVGLMLKAPQGGSGSQVSKEYESGLFDTSYVHTLDIEMEDWDKFIETCTSEEYTACNVTIDGETVENVAIRAKGNTSLTQVKNYDNDRYSFKIEFDHYSNGLNYQGLDKLNLNNIIQDNTYMKDYISFQLMRKMGVSTPLCSYINISVNGENKGLYLAIEGVEDSFLERNYGSDYGQLYKPDSVGAGGGRGNGGKFDMDKWEDENGSDGDEAEAGGETGGNEAGSEKPDAVSGATEKNFDGQQPPEMPKGQHSGDRPEMPEGENGFGGQQPPEMPEGENGFGGQQPPEMPEGEKNFDGQQPPEMPDSESGDRPQMPEGQQSPGGDRKGPNTSDDVLLKYSDDKISSYKNIFDNAKTKVSKSDKKRLIESIKKMNKQEDIESVVDTEAVIKYFAVHNYLCNFDSYTGGMVHNYYLYEKDGKMSMIPWDYNLAFGGFGGSKDAGSLVNFSMDEPVSSGSVEDRPMLSWIFADEKYTEQYHQEIQNFLKECYDSGYIKEEIASVKAMISPYVKDDPTKFCTYEEFEKGIDTLDKFCDLRCKSIKAQLKGEIGSVDASGISISDMGGMGGRR